MVERFLPSDDPISEQVLQWTVNRDAVDIQKLLQWLPSTRSKREQLVLIARAGELLTEIEHAVTKLAELR